jgi:hypothetical protein
MLALNRWFDFDRWYPNLSQKMSVETSDALCRPDGPDFLCVGAQKAGTRWLYDQLIGHPDFWLPPLKELHYFDDTKKFGRRFAKGKIQQAHRQPMLNGRWPPDERDNVFYAIALEISEARGPDPDAYARLFEPKCGQLSGDLTPGYSTLDEGLISEIANRFPTMRIVLILREPIDRFWSQLCMEVRKGRLKLRDPADVEAIMRFALQPGVVGRSFPSIIWSKWSRHFPEQRMGIFLFDDLRRDPKLLRHRILSFLGADPARTNGRAPDFNRKESSAKIEMPNVVREMLLDYFSDELRRCALLFRGPAETWPSRYGL